MLKTFQYRVKDASCAHRLGRHAHAVNLLWNFCNDTQKHALKWNKKWPSGFDLSNLCAGSSKELQLHSQTVQAVCETYAARRSEKRRPHLRYRGRKHTGWIPFKASGIKVKPNGFAYAGRLYKVWMSHPIPEGTKIKTGSFAQNAFGHWHINITVELSDVQALAATKEIGIDLGLKGLAAFSDGSQEQAPQCYRDLEPALATAQRAGKKKQVKAIHAKIANRRKDHLHKLTTGLVRRHGFIAVGNANASALAQTTMAKSELDAGWNSLRNMLRYKAVAHGAIIVEGNEAFSTVTCLCCLPRTGPKGAAGLRISEWQCSECGTAHDRDTNAARNILRLGH